ncbi:endoplasmic reticulum-Golgi intermediate compartment protein 2-like isoform X3 [Tubulanus polymorphus]|uniref:endoplasmic reticulum-Golgi intermediate compartment protein 2-like isoform X3 n=1 Tax=Tubulanus polymorphus TaxID=672921 RepID=UPI003DA5F496
MRRLNAVKNKPVLKVVKELDAFPKVPESYTETSASGGGISILTFIIIIILVISEFRYYTSTKLKYDYEVDRDPSQLLPINIDMTIAMKCDQIGADVVDLTGQNADSHGKLFEDPVYFDLSPAQQQYQNMVHRTNTYIRSQYHAIHDLMWQSGYQSMGGMPKRETPGDGEPDACQIYGTLFVNKVAGNFHITAGKPLNLENVGHVHTHHMVDQEDYNFTHRIDHFSFGEYATGRVNPLDGDQKVVTDGFHMFQYFIEVVPTSVKTHWSKADTYQYAVSERNRSIDHSKGSHGIPGIFVKYDVSSFKVHVKEEHLPYSQFLIRLCGIVGGIFTTSGLINNLVGALVNVVCCQYFKNTGKNTQSDGSTVTVPPTMVMSKIPIQNLSDASPTETPSVSLVAPS